MWRSLATNPVGVARPQSVYAFLLQIFLNLYFKVKYIFIYLPKYYINKTLVIL